MFAFWIVGIVVIHFHFANSYACWNSCENCCVEPLLFQIPSAKAVSPLERGEPSLLSHCAPLSRGAVTSVTEGLFVVPFSSLEVLLLHPPPHPLLHSFSQIAFIVRFSAGIVVGISLFQLTNL
jgi:hypothetical protein